MKGSGLPVSYNENNSSSQIVMNSLTKTVLETAKMRDDSLTIVD